MGCQRIAYNAVIVPYHFASTPFSIRQAAWTQRYVPKLTWSWIRTHVHTNSSEDYVFAPLQPDQFGNGKLDGLFTHMHTNGTDEHCFDVFAA
jgi:hypothetical protein